MGTHPSEREIRRNPDGPENPAKRRHLKLAAKALGFTAAVTFGGGIGLYASGVYEAFTIKRIVEETYPSVPQNVAEAAAKAITVFEAKAARDVKGAIARGDSEVVIQIPTDDVGRLVAIRKQNAHSEIYRQVNDQTGSTEKIYGGLGTVIVGFFGGMISMVLHNMVEIMRKDQARATAVPQV